MDASRRGCWMRARARAAESRPGVGGRHQVRAAAPMRCAGSWGRAAAAATGAPGLGDAAAATAPSRPYRPHGAPGGRQPWRCSEAKFRMQQQGGNQTLSPVRPQALCDDTAPGRAGKPRPQPHFPGQTPTSRAALHLRIHVTVFPLSWGPSRPTSRQPSPAH
ncbi:dysbindin domain-containing protein 1 isoform X6 [Camelus ferus]|uniref:Dysbindin domain-containing protein 1 isoform X6 n=1 Tax=Camelus ferus TaxID=419612 RepID=A0A8B8RRN8_CAMFR|nr:dysbindin domain-containing protein 1 isoform X6 [Camelus ferus]